MSNFSKQKTFKAPTEEPELFEKVVTINRCAKVVKGGRRFSFSALVVTGDQKGKVGIGYGKAKEVPAAIRKGSEKARQHMFPVEILEDTIPHHVLGQSDGGKVLLRPASRAPASLPVAVSAPCSKRRESRTCSPSPWAPATTSPWSKPQWQDSSSFALRSTSASCVPTTPKRRKPEFQTSTIPAIHEN